MEPTNRSHPIHIQRAAMVETSAKFPNRKSTQINFHCCCSLFSLYFSLFFLYFPLSFPPVFPFFVCLSLWNSALGLHPLLLHSVGQAYIYKEQQRWRPMQNFRTGKKDSLSFQELLTPFFSSCFPSLCLSISLNSALGLHPLLLIGLFCKKALQKRLYCAALRQHKRTATVKPSHTATHWNTLEHAATHCNTLQHSATQAHSDCCPCPSHKLTLNRREKRPWWHLHTLQHTATHCNTLQHTHTATPAPALHASRHYDRRRQRPRRNSRAKIYHVPRPRRRSRIRFPLWLARERYKCIHISDFREIFLSLSLSLSLCLSLSFSLSLSLSLFLLFSWTSEKFLGSQRAKKKERERESERERKKETEREKGAYPPTKYTASSKMTVEMTRVRVPRLFYSRNEFFVKRLQRVRVIMSFDEKKKK